MFTTLGIATIAANSIHGLGALTSLQVAFAAGELAFGVAGVALISFLNGNLGAASKTKTAPSPDYKVAA